MIQHFQIIQGSWGRDPEIRIRSYDHVYIIIYVHNLVKPMCRYVPSSSKRSHQSPLSRNELDRTRQGGCMKLSKASSGLIENRSKPHLIPPLLPRPSSSDVRYVQYNGGIRKVTFRFFFSWPDIGWAESHRKRRYNKGRVNKALCIYREGQFFIKVSGRPVRSWAPAVFELFQTTCVQIWITLYLGVCPFIIPNRCLMRR
jgi:hypothetical protein